MSQRPANDTVIAGGEDQERTEMDVLRDQLVHHRDHQDEHDPDQQQRAVQLPWLPHASQAVPSVHIFHIATVDGT
ncbi:hypothetical protein [Streptomyces sp. N2A]|uniref:hypothetical protein n=1 Tax=Streptomyces sp. N2A TaxID=3073936 RepID=UPI002870A3C1|nr:hypothetical protein [Streptomyces sp. N2A]